MFKLTTDDEEGQTPEIIQPLDNLVREGVRHIIVAALEAEVEQYVAALRHLRDENGHALVVRNGKSHHERTVQMGAGSVKIRAPRWMIGGPSTALAVGCCHLTCGVRLV
jgi:hypothetical protein